MEGVAVQPQVNPCTDLSAGLRCDSCDRNSNLVPGEAEALSALDEAISALTEAREISERMDFSCWLLEDSRSPAEVKSLEVQGFSVFEGSFQGVSSRSLFKESQSQSASNDLEEIIATEKLEIVASRLARKYGRKSTRVTLSAKAETLGKENEDKTCNAKPGNLIRPENNLPPIKESPKGQTAGTQTETTKRKSWNIFKNLFSIRKRK